MNRLKTVIVLYAVIMLFIAIFSGFFPRYELISLWMDSWVLKAITFIICWAISPWIYNHLDGRLKKDKSR